jgi:hypothetical protein
MTIATEDAAMPSLKAKLQQDQNRRIAFRCLGGVDYTGYITQESDVGDDYLDIASDQGRRVRLFVRHIIAMEFLPDTGGK